MKRFFCYIKHLAVWEGTLRGKGKYPDFDDLEKVVAQVVDR